MKRQELLEGSERQAHREPEDLVRFTLPNLAELADFAVLEVGSAIGDIRETFEEVVFDRRGPQRFPEHHSMEWQENRQRDEDPFEARWSTADQTRQRDERDHEQELDFDR
jgi:hypothetical protein